MPAGQSDGGRWTGGGSSGGSSALGLSNQNDGTPVQLDQDVPDLGAPAEPTADEAYRRLLDKLQTSRDSGMQLSPQDITRVDIALTAEDYAGSTRWSFRTLDPRTLAMGYPLGTNKCSLFVAQVLGWNDASAGFPNSGQFSTHPPRADQWADPNFVIPGWTPLAAGNLPEAGDVAAQGANFTDAFGHVMIVGTGNTLVGTVDGQNIEPQGVVARIPMKQDIVPVKLRTGPILFRRFTGK